MGLMVIARPLGTDFIIALSPVIWKPAAGGYFGLTSDVRIST